MKNFFLSIIFVVVGSTMLFAEEQQSTKAIILDPNINDQQEILNMRKLDLRPGDIIPRSNNQYSLGNSNYAFLSAVLGTLIFTDGTSQTSAFSGLKIKQVLISSTTTDYAYSSSAFSDTNLTRSITPSSTTSRIFILAMGTINTGDVNAIAYATIARSGTNLGTADGMARCQNTSGQVLFPVTLIYLDSPNTTSAVTYTVRVRNSNNSTSQNFGLAPLQVMVLVEIAN